ncbi:hypothetical protein [Burkholderia sp. BE17]|uniref:hypothetical protein n=1 Tax=Burkholderia sp. BE17 TaxID=2656644 RepID=UPI0039EF94A4
MRLSGIDPGVAQVDRLRRNQATIQIHPDQDPPHPNSSPTNCHMPHIVGIDIVASNSLVSICCDDRVSAFASITLSDTFHFKA